MYGPFNSYTNKPLPSSAIKLGQIFKIATLNLSPYSCWGGGQKFDPPLQFFLQNSKKIGLRLLKFSDFSYIPKALPLGLKPGFNTNCLSYKFFFCKHFYYTTGFCDKKFNFCKFANFFADSKSRAQGFPIMFHLSYLDIKHGI